MKNVGCALRTIYQTPLAQASRLCICKTVGNAHAALPI
jgi:hypothetical protein